MSYKKLFIAALFLLSACTDNNNDPVDAPEEEVTIPVISYSVKKNLPHDTQSFTEGLLVHNGQIFESTGSPQESPELRSVIGIVDTLTGKLAVKTELDRKVYFGEGIVILNDKIYQLTYKNQQGFVYDLKTFQKIKDFRFNSVEGWGMTTDGKQLIMSDGTSILTYLDPETLEPVKKLNVTDGGYQRNYLNELEWIKGFIYANVWGTTEIVKIDPATGNVVGRMDMKRLFDEAATQYPEATDMNGIAYDAATDRIYVTGKLWPYIYEIAFVH